ncbi:hypothetical protein AK812_SmicGene32765 [Symbiodinium microadriaticum]|uniref:Microbial-type PARG catalytic domain-containing protein n=1 Tax=Symbiodinium microadriaticum TaxID=2951 RepID=A0A1Q9CT96_SYMMI|nr:hypothetical protein AK812_SmicGene32765 [Symbiodinium microadriaticum]
MTLFRLQRYLEGLTRSPHPFFSPQGDDAQLSLEGHNLKADMLQSGVWQAERWTGKEGAVPAASFSAMVSALLRSRRLLGDQLSQQIQDLKASSYDRYKHLCYVYGLLLYLYLLAATLMISITITCLDALIQVLASRYGWPEVRFQVEANALRESVAFLRIDRRGAGRLGATELRMGLLLGARIDFPAVTGLTAEALLSAMDSRGAGPGIWKEFGATEVLAVEKLRVFSGIGTKATTVVKEPKVDHIHKDSLISIGEADTDAGSPLSSSEGENESEASPFSRQNTHTQLKANAPIFTPCAKTGVPEAVHEQEAICKAVADAARVAATATFRPPPPQELLLVTCQWLMAVTLEPAPLFICSAMPAPMKVYTPLPTRALNPYLPAKKMPAFAAELGLAECAESPGGVRQLGTGTGSTSRSHHFWGRRTALRDEDFNSATIVFANMTQAFEEFSEDGRLNWPGFEANCPAQQVFAGMAESDARGFLSVQRPRKTRATWDKATEDAGCIEGAHCGHNKILLVYAVTTQLAPFTKVGAPCEIHVLFRGWESEWDSRYQRPYFFNRMTKAEPAARAAPPPPVGTAATAATTASIGGDPKAKQPRKEGAGAAAMEARDLKKTDSELFGVVSTDVANSSARLRRRPSLLEALRKAASHQVFELSWPKFDRNKEVDLASGICTFGKRSTQPLRINFSEAQQCTDWHAEEFKNRLEKVPSSGKWGAGTEEATFLGTDVAENNYALRNQWAVPRIRTYKRLQGQTLLPSKIPCLVPTALMFFGREPSRKAAWVVGLNFANGQSVGGGYKNGAYAQEEDLCRRMPTLYTSLYNAKRAFMQHWPQILHNTDVIIASNIKFADPPERYDKDLMRSWHDEHVHRRLNTVKAVLLAPLNKQPEDPYDIAELFVKALVEHRLGRLYREVHFAIPQFDVTDQNPTVFREIFRRKAVKFKEIEMTLGCNVGQAANLDFGLDSSTDLAQGTVLEARLRSPCSRVVAYFGPLPVLRKASEDENRFTHAGSSSSRFCQPAWTSPTPACKCLLGAIKP